MATKAKKKTLKIPLLPEEYDEIQEIKSKITEEVKEFQETLLDELAELITSALGLMAALSWRGVIKEFVDQYIKRFFGNISGLISELIFALLITFLAVFITWRIAKLKEKLIKPSSPK